MPAGFGHETGQGGPPLPEEGAESIQMDAVPSDDRARLTNRLPPLLAGVPGDASKPSVPGTGKEQLALTHGAEPLHFVDFSADGMLALTCGSDRKVRVWNAETGEPLRTFEGHKERVWCAVCVARFELPISEEWLKRQRVAHLN